MISRFWFPAVRFASFSRFNVLPRELEVCETEDAALLMALEQGWFGFGRWQVIDAEGCCVGRVIGSHLLDEQGARFASIWHESAALQSIRGKNGNTFARLETADDGAALVRFADDLGANPFLRMLLLGACILQQPGPPRVP